MGRVVRRRRLPRVTEWTVYGRRLQIGRKTVAETGATMGATMGTRWRSAHLGEGGGGETRSGGGERFGGLMVATRPDRRWRHRRGSADAEIRGRRLGEPSGGRGHGAQARRRQIWRPGGFSSGERFGRGLAAGRGAVSGVSRQSVLDEEEVRRWH
ncbi:uncharacterized protein M6B38_305620 [Iris pallida]|uniref:Uncharacterized protein n=1 Tax=Iris pallida TaxID=29817 RepID=A0AAX6HKQ3_IRIPA|nr:uncharacterized protein M6B38_305620 [Iris pallida]